jgi:hypothetical protein
MADVRSRERTPAVNSDAHDLRGVFAFAGRGLHEPFPVDAGLRYTVPAGSVARAVRFHVANRSDDMACVVLVCDGSPMRYFPVAAQSQAEIPPSAVEGLRGGSTLELQVAAPRGRAGSLAFDLSLDVSVE